SRLVFVEIEQACAGSGSAEHAERRRRMPALFVMVEVDTASQRSLELEACDIGREHVATVGAPLFGQRQQGRQDGCGRVATEVLRAVIVVEHVRGDAVCEGRVEGARAAGGAPYKRL